MSNMDVNQVLAQIRALQAQASMRPSAPTQPVDGPKGGGFDGMLRNAIDQVNESQMSAVKLQDSFSRGDRSVELADVMLASAKAQVNFRAMTEVRNRLVSAYQDIMNMPV